MPVLDDARDEGEETFMLTLSRASGARIARAAATGTLANDDTMPRPWLARFGRTVASQVLDAVNARFAGSSSPRVTVGGVELRRSRTEAALPGAVDRPYTDVSGEPWGRDRGRAFTPTARELLVGSAFHLRAEENRGAPAFAAWGRIATSGFDADVDDTRLDGDVTTGIAGADAEWDRMLAGIALSYSEGDGTFALTSGMASNRERGEIESTLMSVYPYARARLSERISAWALAGAGTGELVLTEEGGVPLRTDIDMRMGAIGARGTLVPAPVTGGVALSVRSDALWMRISSGAVGSLTAVNLEASEADAARVRLVLEGERVFALSGGGTFTPTFEVAARHDDGDAETGTGLEIAAGLRYLVDGMTIEGSARTLVAHEYGSHEEWGVGGSIRIDPDASGRGLSLVVAPSVGATSNGVERLWSLADARSLVPDGEFDEGSRLESEVGYGLLAPAGCVVMTPYAGLSLSDGGGRTVRLGTRWAVASDIALGIESAHGEDRFGTPDREIRLHAAARW